MNWDDREVAAVRLVQSLKALRPDWSAWRGGWPGEADAALVDAVFSSGAKYESTVLPLVQRWRSARDGRPELGTGVSALTKAGLDFVDGIAKNDQRVKGRPLRNRKNRRKIEVLLDLAERMTRPEVGLDTADQIVSRAIADRGVVRRLTEEVKGIGPATSSYFLMLLGVQGVKADSLVSEWVEKQVGNGRLSQSDVEEVVERASQLIGVEPIRLDHAIWRHESNTRRARRRRG